MLGLPIPSLGTLLSLPLLSFLVLPSFLSNFSWTTWLNLLFFWLTWTTVVLSHDALTIEFFATFAVRVLFYILPSTVFLILDIGVPSFSLGIKTHGTLALPRRAASRQALWRYLGIVLFNIMLSVTIQTLLDYAFTGPLNLRSALRISISLPMPLALAKDLTRAYLIRGPLAYYIHRFILHAQRNSNLVADQLTQWHNSWHHGLATTMPFAAAYDHPAVYLLHKFLPVYLPALVFRFHILTYLLFVSLISLEETFVWSGYSILPGTVMLAGMARRTESHLMIGGGNYGPWGVMDWIHGTTVGDADVMDDIGEEVEKRDVRGKARRAVNKTSDAVRSQIRAPQISDSDHDASGAEVQEVVPRARRSRKVNT